MIVLPPRINGIAAAWLLAAAFRTGLPAAAQVPAVMYHAHANLGYLRENFTAHLDYLAANSFSTITLDEFYEWRVNDGILPYRPIMLTVDDNYVLGYTEMYPALASRGMVATNYTHTRGIGIGAPKASWDQVVEMDAAGVFLVEAHTQTHPRLTTITASQVRQEVIGSRNDIAANVGGKVSNHFAYPYGSYDQSVIAELQAAGFKTAMTTKKGLNTRLTPLYELRRWGGDGRDLAAFLAESGLGTLPPPPPGPGWILDDADPAALPQAAAWMTLPAAHAYQGQSLVSTGDPSAMLRWAAYLPEAGTMTVHARWSATTDRAAEATYTIAAADGPHVVTVDQRSRGGEWVPLGTYSFAPGQPASVTLGGTAGTLSADAIWFEPIATPGSPGELLIDVPSGVSTQSEAGWAWIGPEWSSLTKSGNGALVLDRQNQLAGPLTIAAGSLQVTTGDALSAVDRIAVAADAVLDVAALSDRYRVPAGQTIAGNGRVAGSITFGRDATISPGLAVDMPSTASLTMPIVVPEPSTTSLLLLSGVGLLIGRRRASIRPARSRSAA